MRSHDLLIIGTGSGNTILDERFDDLDVAIVEEGTFGGTCLNVGCVPTKMFVYAADVARSVATSGRYGIDAAVDKVRWPDIRDRILGRIDPIAVDGERYRREAPNVTVYRERARFVGFKTLGLADGLEVKADRIVIAAGSRPVVPNVPGLTGPRVHTSDSIMRIDDLPASLVILGGGVIAAEMAHVFSSLGTDVTVVARSGGLVIHEDRSVSERFTTIARQRWDVRTDTWVLEAPRIAGTPCGSRSARPVASSRRPPSRRNSCWSRPAGCRTPTGSTSPPPALRRTTTGGSWSTTSSRPWCRGSGRWATCPASTS
jgi:mycothione reductase